MFNVCLLYVSFKCKKSNSVVVLGHFLAGIVDI